jgi:hypothetical protein
MSAHNSCANTQRVHHSCTSFLISCRFSFHASTFDRLSRNRFITNIALVGDFGEACFCRASLTWFIVDGPPLMTTLTLSDRIDQVVRSTNERPHSAVPSEQMWSYNMAVSQGFKFTNCLTTNRNWSALLPKYQTIIYLWSIKAEFRAVAAEANQGRNIWGSCRMGSVARSWTVRRFCNQPIENLHHIYILGSSYILVLSLVKVRNNQFSTSPPTSP